MNCCQRYDIYNAHAQSSEPRTLIYQHSSPGSTALGRWLNLYLACKCACWPDETGFTDLVRLQVWRCIIGSAAAEASATHPGDLAYPLAVVQVCACALHIACTYTEPRHHIHPHLYRPAPQRQMMSLDGNVLARPGELGRQCPLGCHLHSLRISYDVVTLQQALVFW